MNRAISEFGTNAMCRLALKLSACRARPSSERSQNDAIDPTRTCGNVPQDRSFQRHGPPEPVGFDEGVRPD
jgi:hypothetical protein